jgi:hypothetical protein
MGNNKIQMGFTAQDVNLPVIKNLDPNLSVSIFFLRMTKIHDAVSSFAMG